MLRHLDECIVSPHARSTNPPKVLHLRLTPEVLQQLQESSADGVSISFDTAMTLTIGSQSHPFSITPEASSIDIYRRTSQKRVRHMEMVGKMTHKLIVRRELGGSISQKLKLRQAEEAAAKQERSIQSTDIDQRTVKGKPNMLSRPSTPVLARAASPVRKSPFLQAKKSPLLVASNAKTPTIPLRTRLIQVLASGAASDTELSARLRVPGGSLSEILEDVATRRGEDWALRDALYQEVKFWDWKGYTTSERSCAISRAVEAMDRSGLSANHPARSKLIHPDKRTAEERSDTSPLSLNAPINANSYSEPPAPITSITAQAPSESTIRPEPRKVTAKGILSQGKATGTKKSNVAPKSKTLPPTEQTVPGDRKAQADKSIGQARTTQKSATAAAPSSSNVSNEKRHREEIETDPKKARVTATVTGSPRLQASVPTFDASSHRTEKSAKQNEVNSSSEKQKSGVVTQRQSSQVQSKSIEPVQRSQTPKAVPAPVAPSTGSMDSVAEELHKRTASITSSTTDRSERSVLSASSASTAPSLSATSPPPAKVRSKFLTTKKKTLQTTPHSAASTPRASPAPPSRTDSKVLTPVSIRETSHGSPTPTVCKKRKAEAAIESPAKRIQTIDLQDMAKSYKQLYPEYKVLHDMVITKLGDQDLFSKFMAMHNQMSSWKQTLKKAPKAAETS